MKKKIVKLLSAMCMFALMSLGNVSQILAYYPGSTFSVSISCGNLEGNIRAIGSNATVTSNPNWCDRNTTVTAKATANGTGTATLQIVAVDIVDVVTLEQISPGTVLGTQSITVESTPPSGGGNTGGGNTGGGNTGGGNTGGGNTGGGTTTPPTATTPDDSKSGVNTLSALEISKGELTPAFSSDVTSYNVVLSEEEIGTPITITGTPTDAKATVSGDGTFDLIGGDNKFNIQVDAENGSPRYYDVTVVVDQAPEVSMKFNDNDYGVVVDPKGAPVPDGYEQTTITVDGKEIPAFKNVNANIILLYVIDGNGDKVFMIYDEETASIISKYNPITLAGVPYLALDVPEDMKVRVGMEFMSVTLEDQEMDGWKYEEEELDNYSHVYLMNEKGESSIYQYEETEQSVQLYHSEPGMVSKEDLDTAQANTNRNKYIAVGLGAVNSVTLILVIYLFARNKKMNSVILRREKNYEDTLNEKGN